MIVLPCTNDDESCGPEAFHRFPEEGETVELTCASARIIGSDMEVTDTASEQGVVTGDIIQAAHQVGVRLKGHNYDVVVWVDVTDEIKEKKS